MVGAYLVLLGVNYIPMLVQALVLSLSRSRPEPTTERRAPRGLVETHRRQALWLLVPFAVWAVLLLPAGETLYGENQQPDTDGTADNQDSGMGVDLGGPHALPNM